MSCSRTGWSGHSSPYGYGNGRQWHGPQGGGHQAPGSRGAPSADSGDIDGPDTIPGSQSSGSGGSNEAVNNAINQIRNSKFAQTDKGKEVIAKLDELNRNGHIVIGDLGGNIAGRAGDGTLRLDDGLFTADGAHNLVDTLIHETGHELQAKHGIPVSHDPGPYSPEQLVQEYENNI